jgi:hypothetical protein
MSNIFVLSSPFKISFNKINGIVFNMKNNFPEVMSAISRSRCSWFSFLGRRGTS